MATPGTIAEYDIVLSISEEAINAQFQLLYNKTIAGTPLKPPPGLKKVAPPPPSKYLINHELEIHVAEPNGDGTSSIDMEGGLFAHIKCPRVSFRDSGTTNKARVEIEFQRDETVKDETRKDSVYMEWVGPRRHPELKPTIVTGWKMSWIVDLGMQNIQDIMTDLITPAESKDDPSVLHPDAVKAIKPLANGNFTVSAIFCVFDAAQISSSFKFVDANGVDAKISAASVADLASKVSTYFSMLQQAVPPGRATPDHPFVLGYGLSQKLETIEDIVGAGVDTKDTPKYFIPKSYIVSVTPGSGKYTGGTFNFCILTHRDSNDSWPVRDANLTDRDKNLNAGKLEQTFMDLTRTKEQDGVMAISRDLIFSKFLCPQLSSSFFIDIKDIFKQAMSQGSCTEDGPQTDSYGIRTQDSPPTYYKKQTAKYSGRITRRFIDDTQSVGGSSEFDLSWTSSLQTDPNVEKPDALRRATLTFTSHVKEDYDFVDVGVFTDDKFFAHVDMIYKYVLHITPGKGGLIDIVQDNDESKRPERGDDGKLKLINSERPEGQYGSYYTTKTDGNPIWLFIKDILSKLSPELKESLEKTLKRQEDTWADKIASTAIAEYESKWKAGITSVRNKVILPAGNVFNFSGVDIDDKGNMYTHISFLAGDKDVTVNKDDEHKGNEANVGH